MNRTAELRLIRQWRYFAVALFFVVCFPLAFTLAQEGNGDQLRPVTVKIAGEDYPLLFEGAELSQERRNVIAADIEFLLSDLNKATFVEIGEKGGEFCAGDYNHAVTHWLNIEELERWLPNAMMKYFGAAVKVDESYGLVVCQALTKVYSAILERSMQWPSILKQLDEFMAILRTPERRRVIALDPEKAREMFFFCGMKPWEEDEPYRSNLLGDACYKMRRPSLLEFNILDKFCLGSQPAEAPVCCVLMQEEKTSGGSVDRWPPFVYANNRWHILVLPLP